MLRRANERWQSEQPAKPATLTLQGKIAALSKNPLVGKLERVTTLSDEGRQAAADVPMTMRSFQPHHEIALAGDCCLIIEGWTCRYYLRNEGRQITAFSTAGDMPDLYVLHAPVMDHGFAALTTVSVGFFRRADIRDLAMRFPEIGGALWREAFAEVAILREWIVGMGRKCAFGRTAHLLCELILKLHAAGLADDHCCDFLITQSDMADALGLSIIHVNRTLQQLRERGIVTLRDNQLVIHDWTALAKIAEFEPAALKS